MNEPQFRRVANPMTEAQAKELTSEIFDAAYEWSRGITADEIFRARIEGILSELTFVWQATGEQQ